MGTGALNIDRQLHEILSYDYSHGDSGSGAHDHILRHQLSGHGRETHGIAVHCDRRDTVGGQWKACQKHATRNASGPTGSRKAILLFIFTKAPDRQV